MFLACPALILERVLDTPREFARVNFRIKRNSLAEGSPSEATLVNSVCESKTV